MLEDIYLDAELSVYYENDLDYGYLLFDVL